MLPALSDMNMRLICSPLLWGFTYTSKRRYLSIWSSGQMSSLWMTNKCFHFHRLSPSTLLMARRRSLYHILLKLFGKWKCFPVIFIFPFSITPLFLFSQNTGEFCFFLWNTMKHSWISDAVTLSVTPCLDILVMLIYTFGRREAPLA